MADTVFFSVTEASKGTLSLYYLWPCVQASKQHMPFHWDLLFTIYEHVYRPLFWSCPSIVINYLLCMTMFTSFSIWYVLLLGSTVYYSQLNQKLLTASSSLNNINVMTRPQPKYHELIYEYLINKTLSDWPMYSQLCVKDFDSL